MSNGSKSVNDGFLGRDEEQSEKENMQIESCIAFSQLHNHFMFLILGFSRLAPPSGLEVVVWKPCYTILRTHAYRGSCGDTNVHASSLSGLTSVNIQRGCGCEKVLVQLQC